MTVYHETDDIDQFRSRLENMGSLPSLPVVVVELLDRLNDEHTSNQQIVELIRQDAGLTARLLKLVNSAAMGLRVQVSSIQRAVELLGRRQIREICLGAGVWDALAGKADLGSFDLSGFERHSLAVAELAQELATRSTKAEAEDVYASALLHDVGKFLLLIYDGDAYSTVLRNAAAEKRDLEELEYETIGWTHTQVGGWLAEYWKLPGTVHEAVRWHHQPSGAMSGSHGDLVALVAVADNLAKVMKIGGSGNPAVSPIGSLLADLNLSPQDIKEVGESVKEKLERPPE